MRFAKSCRFYECLLKVWIQGKLTSSDKVDINLNTYIVTVVMGKVEGQGESWHCHVSAVTIAPEYRRQQLAKKLMNLLEAISDKM